MISNRIAALPRVLIDHGRHACGHHQHHKVVHIFLLYVQAYVLSCTMTDPPNLSMNIVGFLFSSPFASKAPAVWTNAFPLPSRVMEVIIYKTRNECTQGCLVIPFVDRGDCRGPRLVATRGQGRNNVQGLEQPRLARTRRMLRPFVHVYGLTLERLAHLACDRPYGSLFQHVCRNEQNLAPVAVLTAAGYVIGRL